MSPAPRDRAPRPLRDGDALDRMTEGVEAWAASYRPSADESRWEADFERRFAPLAAELAERSTPEARPFRAGDWVLAIALWAAIAGAVFSFSLLLMRPEGLWVPIFGAVALGIAVVGIRQSRLELSSERRVAEKRAKKEQWLLGVTRKTMIRRLRERRAAEGREGGR